MITIPLTREQFQLKKLQLAKNGITFDDPAQDSGSARYSGIHVQYEFKETTLSLSVVKRPFMAPLSAIEETMRRWFE